jgi:hypothetical protein
MLTSDGREVSVHISASDVSYSGHHAVLQILNEVVPQGTAKKQWKRLFKRQIPNKGQVQRGDEESERIRVSRPETGGNEDAVPICASCKMIRISPDEWIRFESFFKELYGVEFNHGICSECAHRLWPDMPPEVRGETDV